MVISVRVLESGECVHISDEDLCNLSVRTVVKLCTLCVFALGMSFVYWIVVTSACVVDKHFEISSLFLIPFMLIEV